MSQIKCGCGRLVPDLSVSAALEVGNHLKCTGCNKIIHNDTLKILKARPLSRRGHPNTSQEAAQYMQSKLRATQLYALRMVRENPGKTANELSVIANERDNRKIGRRLPELERMGLIIRKEPRPCEVTGRNATVWDVVEISA